MLDRNSTVKKIEVNRQTLMGSAFALAPLVLCLLGLLCSDFAFAAQEDALRDHTGRIEGFLTGNLLRMSVLGGTIWGAVQSYMAGKFVILASTLGIGLGTYGILEWAKTTWAMVL
jgi:hypothetical protein